MGISSWTLETHGKEIGLAEQLSQHDLSETENVGNADGFETLYLLFIGDPLLSVCG